MSSLPLSAARPDRRLLPSSLLTAGETQPFLPAPPPGRYFYQHSRAWYRDANPLADGAVDDVLFGDGESGELKVLWRPFEDQLWPRLELYDDCWAALQRLPEVVRLLGSLDGQSVSPDAFCRELGKLGFVDATPLIQP